MFSTYSNTGGLFFLYGCGGIGKAFLWRAISFAFMSKGEIILIVTNRIFALLIPSGRIAHSRFHIPIQRK